MALNPTPITSRQAVRGNFKLAHSFECKRAIVSYHRHVWCLPVGNTNRLEVSKAKVPVLGSEYAPRTWPTDYPYFNSLWVKFLGAYAERRT
ncbi:uncharacterized protein N7518_002668 [Penicillium psychrosexuale]|uniref:uncharacterized protein n=1 Tax=Penicillium psychrosexuale TaxID=1002107 RepID=UPI002544E6C1|nr:uncharacterized protein N7518_002668 [Penicillium psychrosexuale]KAJ5800600.1 hypothetical protein N7518_002668 [Penicillium psychrosexuale]